MWDVVSGVLSATFGDTVMEKKVYDFTKKISFSVNNPKVYSVSFSPDGAKLASGTGDSSVKVTPIIRFFYLTH